MVQDAVLAFGGLDIVVNNAGVSLSKPLLETTEQDWDFQHDIMAKGSFLVSKATAPVLIEQGMGGDVIYISSKNSVFAGPNNIAYSATKADQAHQVRLLAVELGEHGIKVNGINPDGVVRGSGIFAGGWGANRAAVYGVPEEELGAFYAQRTQYADLFPALIHRDAKRIEDDKNADQQGDKTGHSHPNFHRRHSVFDALSARSRSANLQCGRHTFFDSALQLFDRHSGFIHQINAVNIAPSIENKLRVKNVHHCYLSTKDFANARRFNDTAHSEFFSALRSEQRQFVAFF